MTLISDLNNANLKNNYCFRTRTAIITVLGGDGTLSLTDCLQNTFRPSTGLFQFLHANLKENGTNFLEISRQFSLKSALIFRLSIDLHIIIVIILSELKETCISIFATTTY